MNKEQIEELKRLAEKNKHISYHTEHEDLKEDVQWLTAANPQTILSLIARLESLEAKLSAARECIEFYADQEMYLQGCEVGDITEWELDCYGRKAREALAKLNGGENG